MEVSVCMSNRTVDLPGQDLSPHTQAASLFQIHVTGRGAIPASTEHRISGGVMYSGMYNF
jgi:hypothetical protein